MNAPIAWCGLRPGEIAVDLFAGGGGASSGTARAIGRSPDVAVNHDPLAIAMHRANHPTSRHYLEDVWRVNPIDACAGRHVGFMWASPDCADFSKAKNGKPRSKKIRALAWVVNRWAHDVRPRVIVLENVEEFLGWGPLLRDGTRCPKREGSTFRAFVRKLERLGYRVEWRLLVAADYGAPTTRKRLFMIARCDGEPIAWPEPTHGPGRARAWRTAAEIIDWSVPCPSIFDRKEPLAEATLRRIAVGVHRYVINAARPFIVPVTHPRDARVHSIDEPVRTITGAHRGELALVAPTLVQTGYGEREGQTPRALDISKPLGTVVACGQKHALVAAYIAKHYGSPPDRMRAIGHELDAPLSTITARDHHALTAAFITKFYGTATGSPCGAPLPTVTGGGQHLGAVQALLERYAPSRGLFDGPPGTVRIDGELWLIVDIGMRMLSPRELFRAQGFDDNYIIDLIRPNDERIAPRKRGKPFSKEDQIALAGNSVCPPLAEAIARANLSPAWAEARTA